jgi:hypothetical protein
VLFIVAKLVSYLLLETNSFTLLSNTPLSESPLRWHLKPMSALRVKHLLHRNKEGIQINMEDTANHETVYKPAHGADNANLSLDC